MKVSVDKKLLQKPNRNPVGNQQEADLFPQAGGVLQQLVHLVGLLPPPGHLGVLAGEHEVGQDVHHELGEAAGQQLPPVGPQQASHGLDLIKVLQEDQVGDQHLAGGAAEGGEHGGSRRDAIQTMGCDGYACRWLLLANKSRSPIQVMPIFSKKLFCL